MNIKVCTETFNLNNPASMETYISLGGYGAWKKIVERKSSKIEIINKIKESALDNNRR